MNASRGCIWLIVFGVMVQTAWAQEPQPVENPKMQVLDLIFKVEDIGGKAPGAAHAVEPLGPVKLDDMAARLCPVFGAYLDIFGHGHKIG